MASTRFCLALSYIGPQIRIDSFLLYFKRSVVDSSETFSVDIKFDSITIKSENFQYLDRMVDEHIKALDIIFSTNKRDFSPKSQTFIYQANAKGEEKELDQYLESLHAFRPKLAGGLKSRGAVYGFDGPKTNSTLLLVVADSLSVPGGLYLSLQFFFPGETENYKELFQLCMDFSKDQILPSLELNFKENNEVE